MTDERGFTLVEVLAALVVGGLLIAELGWTMGGLGDELHARPKHPELAAVRVIAPPLSALLTGALPPTPGGAGFDGDRDYLKFHTAPPAALGAIGPMTAELRVRATATGRGLFLQLTPDMRGDHLPGAVTDERRLADGFAEIDFSYETRPRPNAATLPRLITISFTAKDGRTAKIVAAPRLTSDGNCRFDPISMACRA